MNQIQNADRFLSREHFNAFIASRERPTIDKNAFIVEQCRGKTVLDMGCIDHSYQTALGLGQGWLHKQIQDVASRLTGLDILTDDARELNQRGFDIRVGNAEQFDLGQTFDVIVAGDLIEHLSNIGLFLASVKRHMHAGSVFIFSTPNPFNVEQFLFAGLADQINVHPQHASWLNPHVCWELTQRAELKVQDFYWIATRFHFYLNKPGWRYIVNRWARWMMQRHPLLRRDFLMVMATA